MTKDFGDYTAAVTRSTVDASGRLDVRLDVFKGQRVAHFTYEGRWMTRPRRGPPRWEWIPRGQTSDTTPMSIPWGVERSIGEWLAATLAHLGPGAAK